MKIPVQLKFDFGASHTKKTKTKLSIDKTFPEERANQLAHLEAFNKHLYRPNT